MLCFFTGNEIKAIMIMGLEFGPVFHSVYISIEVLLVTLEYVFSLFKKLYLLTYVSVSIKYVQWSPLIRGKHPQ